MANFYKCEECGCTLLQMGSNQPCGSSNLTPLKMECEHKIKIVRGEDGAVTIVGEGIPNPMTEEHHLEWIFAQTSYGGVYVNLNVGDAPETRLKFAPEEVQAVYVYDSMHGLCKAHDMLATPEFDMNNVACSPEFASGCVDPAGLS